MKKTIILIIYVVAAISINIIISDIIPKENHASSFVFIGWIECMIWYGIENKINKEKNN